MSACSWLRGPLGKDSGVALRDTISDSGDAVTCLVSRYRMIVKQLTHHDTAIETLLAIAFEDFESGNDEVIGMHGGGVERMGIGTLVLHLFSEGNTIVMADLYNARLFRSTRLIAPDTAAGNEDTVAKDDFTRFEEKDIADE